MLEKKNETFRYDLSQTFVIEEVDSPEWNSKKSKGLIVTQGSSENPGASGSITDQIHQYEEAYQNVV